MSLGSDKLKITARGDELLLVFRILKIIIYLPAGRQGSEFGVLDL